MKISLKSSIEQNCRELISNDEYNYYLDLKSSFYLDEIVVAGIFYFKNKCNLYLFSSPARPSMYFMANSSFFILIDDTISKYWNHFHNIYNKYMVYFDYNFDCFNFFGINKFANDENFYLNYHQDNFSSKENIKAVNYLEKMTNLLYSEY